MKIQPVRRPATTNRPTGCAVNSDPCPVNGHRVMVCPLGVLRPMPEARDLSKRSRWHNLLIERQKMERAKVVLVVIDDDAGNLELIRAALDQPGLEIVTAVEP